MIRSLSIPPSFMPQGLCTCCFLQLECSLPTVTSSLKPASSGSSWNASSWERVSLIPQSTNIFKTWFSPRMWCFPSQKVVWPGYLHLTSAFCVTLWGPTGANLLILLTIKYQSHLSAHNCWVHICCMNKWMTWEPEFRTFHFSYIYCRPLAHQFLVHSQTQSLRSVPADLCALQTLATRYWFLCPTNWWKHYLARPRMKSHVQTDFSPGWALTTSSFLQQSLLLCLILHPVTGSSEVCRSAQILHCANYHAWLEIVFNSRTL